MSAADSDLQRGLEMLTRGELEAAFWHLKAAASAAPNDRRVRQTLRDFAEKAATCAAEMRHDASGCIRLNQLANEAFVLRAETIREAGDKALLRMVAFNLAAALHRLGRYEEARQHYEDALVLMPEDPDAAINLALLLSESGRADEAVALLTPFVERTPDSGRLVSHLIMALQQAGRFAEAIALASRAAQRFPELRLMYQGYYYRYSKDGERFTA